MSERSDRTVAAVDGPIHPACLSARYFQNFLMIPYSIASRMMPTTRVTIAPRIIVSIGWLLPSFVARLLPGDTPVVQLSGGSDFRQFGSWLRPSSSWPDWLFAPRSRTPSFAAVVFLNLLDRSDGPCP